MPPNNKHRSRRLAVSGFLVASLVVYMSATIVFRGPKPTATLFFRSLLLREEDPTPIVLERGDAAELGAACEALPPSNGSPTALTTAAFVVPFHAWSRLKFAASWAATSASCSSSQYPLREAHRLFLHSDLMSPTEAQASHGFLISALPAALSAELMAVVRSSTVCARLLPALSALEAAAARSPQPQVMTFTRQGIREALCDGGARGDDDEQLPHFVANDRDGGLISVTRMCSSTAQQRSSGSISSVWSLLLDGVLPDGVPLSGSSPIACGESFSAADAHARLTANYAASHNAPSLSNLHHPSRLATGMTHQIPENAVDQNLPILHQNTAELAAAARANDSQALRRLLLPGATAFYLPSLLTSFNVMVSPIGVLQSLTAVLEDDGGGRPALRRTAAAASSDNEGEHPASPLAHGSNSSSSPHVALPCSPLLSSLFEPVPPAATTAAAQALLLRQYIEAGVGGREALQALRARSPRVWFSPYWPPSGGPELVETAQPHSRTLIFDNIANPNFDEVLAQHTACDAWDLEPVVAALKARMKHAKVIPVLTALPLNVSLTPVKFVEEVIVLSLTIDSFYWFSVDVIGRLQLLAPYLAAHPHVAVHVPYWLERRWDDTHHARHWLAVLGITRDRIVSGRIIGRIVHLPDRQPCGPRTHPLQLLGVQDAARRAVALQFGEEQQSATQQQQQRFGATSSSYSPSSSSSDHPRNVNDNATTRQPRVLVVQRSKSRSFAELGVSIIALKQRIGRDVALNVFNPPAFAPVRELVQPVATDTTKTASANANAPSLISSSQTSSLAASLKTWSQSDAVIAPHGAGLTNALALRPHALLIEYLPQGHALHGLYYFQIAHYARLHYHQFIASGFISTSVVMDAWECAPIVCSHLDCGDVPRIPRLPIKSSLELVDYALEPLPESQRAVECQQQHALQQQPTRDDELTHRVSSGSGSTIQQQQDTAAESPGEPWIALQPYPHFNVSYHHAGEPEPRVYVAWTSLPDRLPLSNVEGVCLILSGGGKPPMYIATEPSQRGLIRALERRRILPLVIPPYFGACTPSATKTCYQNLTDGCENRDLRGTAAFAGALLAAVRAARGLNASHPLPLYTAGLSSGAMIVGVLAAHLQIDAAIVQLEAPMASLMKHRAVHVHPASLVPPAASATVLQSVEAPAAAALSTSTTFALSRSMACDLPSMPIAPLPPSVTVALEHQRPVSIPALWLTAARVNPGERGRLLAYAQRWTEIGLPGDRLHFNWWAPSALPVGGLHAMAPWLLSEAAGRVIEDTLVAIGLLVDDPETDAALASYNIDIEDAGCDPSPPQQAAPQAQPARAQPPKTAPQLQLARGQLFRVRSEVALVQLRTLMAAALVFSARPDVLARGTGAGGTRPFLFARAGDASFPSADDDGAALLVDPVYRACSWANFSSLSSAGGCASGTRSDEGDGGVLGCASLSPPSSGGGGGPVPHSACAAALDVWQHIFDAWLPQLLTRTMPAWHEYHTAPWEEMVAWISRFGPHTR